MEINLHITPREYDVLVRLNKTNKRIAYELGIKEQSVKDICLRLCKKFHTHSRLALVLRAIRLRVVEIEAFEL